MLKENFDVLLGAAVADEELPSVFEMPVVVPLPAVVDIDGLPVLDVLAVILLSVDVIADFESDGAVDVRLLFVPNGRDTEEFPLIVCCPSTADDVLPPRLPPTPPPMAVLFGEVLDAEGARDVAGPDNDDAVAAEVVAGIPVRDVDVCGCCMSVDEAVTAVPLTAKAVSDRDKGVSTLNEDEEALEPVEDGTT